MSNHLLLTEDEFDRELSGDQDPLVKIPAGFPSMHARYQETPPPLTADVPDEVAAPRDAQRIADAAKQGWRERIRHLLDDEALDEDHAESFVK